MVIGSDSGSINFLHCRRKEGRINGRKEGRKRREKEEKREDNRITVMITLAPQACIFWCSYSYKTLPCPFLPNFVGEQIA